MRNWPRQVSSTILWQKWHFSYLHNTRDSINITEESIHIVFDETSNGLASTSSFDEFQISKYTDDEVEKAKIDAIIKLLLSTQTNVQIKITKDELLTLKLI